MYLTIKQQLKHLSTDDYRNLRELCRASKNLMNEALYVNRQYFFSERKYLGYEKTYAILKTSENYRILNSNMAQQSMKIVDGMFASFIALLKLVKKKQYDSRAVKIPRYLPKDGFAPLVIQQFTISNQIFVLPYSRQYGAEHSKITIKVPPILEGKKVKFIKIYPLNDAKYFEIQYTYEATEERRELDQQKALAIDFGVNNLMTCATSEGRTFIIDGRRLKAINQRYNKENARLASIKDKQKYGKKPTFRQKQLARKRKQRVNDYISKACRKVIDYCLLHNIGNIVCGYNVTFQRDSHMGKTNNQNFVNIPFGEIRQKLQYLCELYGIEYTEQEESYTSKASFWDKDVMPIYNADNPQKYEFSGKRIYRGLYQTSTGFVFNADVNGALNILRKSNVVSLTRLYSRGGLATPLRIRMPVKAGGNLKSNFLRTPCL
ncbi:MAG: transposase [Synergistaceae bacterium]|nr:transposase [Synergistaceae bacterium]